jgi:hypothetical protein
MDTYREGIRPIGNYIFPNRIVVIGAFDLCVRRRPDRHETSLAWLGLAWLGLAWLGLAWLGLAWLGLAWLGLAWLGLAVLSLARRSGLTISYRI